MRMAVSTAVFSWPFSDFLQAIHMTHMAHDHCENHMTFLKSRSVTGQFAEGLKYSGQSPSTSTVVIIYLYRRNPMYDSVASPNSFLDALPRSQTK